MEPDGPYYDLMLRWVAQGLRRAQPGERQLEQISVIPAERKINTNVGRDHWASAMSVMFAGCGIPGGQVIGATDRNGYAAAERILTPEMFASTIYRKLGIDPDKVLYTPEGRPVHLVSDPTPIAELFA